MPYPFSSGESLPHKSRVYRFMRRIHIYEPKVIQQHFEVTNLPVVWKSISRGRTSTYDSPGISHILQRWLPQPASSPALTPFQLGLVEAVQQLIQGHRLCSRSSLIHIQVTRFPGEPTFRPLSNSKSALLFPALIDVSPESAFRNCPLLANADVL